MQARTFGAGVHQVARPTGRPCLGAWAPPTAQQGGRIPLGLAGGRTTTPGMHLGGRTAAPAQWGRPGSLGIDYSIVWDASAPASE